MKQKYFMLWMLTIVFTVTSYSQTPIITNVVDGTCGSDAKFVELYISGTVDMADYKLVRRSNAGTWDANGADIDISALGTRTDEFVYLIRDLATLNSEFPSANITAGNSEVSGSISHNGDDSYRLVEIAGDVVIDQFGGDIDGTGEAWEYTDSWSSRNGGEGPNPNFTLSEWTFNAIDILDNVGLCNGESTTFEDTVTSIETYVPASTDPATAAPDPTEDSADVISMFSGVYTNVAVDTWLTPWSSASLEDIQIQSNDTKKYTDLDFAGIETVANPIDASGMDFFHIDVYSPNATTFGVKLVDLGAGVEGEIDFNIAQDQWVSLEIPLDDFADPALVTDPNNLLTVRNSIQQLIISGEPVGGVTAYVDNVYFSQTPAATSCDFVLRMEDSFGDGWNGNTMDLSVNGTVVLDDVTVEATDNGGSFNEIAFAVTDGDEITTTWNGGGGFGSETSYEILDPNGVVVGSGAETSITTPITVACPTCFTPQNPSVDNITTTSVDVNWVEEDPSTATDGYEVVVMASGDDPDTENPAVPAETVGNGVFNATVNGLSSGTSYDAYVRSDCGGGDMSPWSGVVSFSTDCTSFTTPYSENFDGVTSPAIANCWSTVGNQASEVTTEESDFGLDDPPSSPNFVLFEDGFNLEDGDEAILVSPQFSDLPDADNRIRFKAAFQDGDAEDHKLFVGVMSDPTDPTTFVEVDVVTSSTGGSFVEYTVNLDDATLISSNEYIAIAGGSVADFDDIALDDFVYEEIPTCFKPQNLAASNITTDSVDFNWDEESPSTATDGYEVVIMASGDAPDTANAVSTETVGNGVFTASVTGLTENTPYDAYVRSVCDAANNEVSAWSDVSSFTTSCVADIAPYNENFDGANFVTGTGFGNEDDAIDSCWNRTPDNDGSDYFWGTRSGDTGSGPTGPDDDVSGGGNYIFIEASGGNVGDEALMKLPTLDLSALTAPSISFFYHMYGSGMGTLSVEVKDVADASYTEVFTISGQQQTDNADAFIEQFVDLSSFAGQTVNIRFKGVNDNDNGFGDIAIDEVSVDEAPLCIKPENLTASNTTTDSVDLTWDEESPSSATDGYEWVVMSSGDAPDTANAEATGTVPNGTFTTNVTSLTTGTDYDAYVRSVCDAASSEVSDWSAVESFSTLPDFCAGDNFFDNGGPNDDYEVNSDEVTTITPDNAGDVVTVEFLSFAVENGWDGLLIHDGPDTSAPLIDSGGTGFQNAPDGAWTGSGTDDTTDPFSAEGETFVSSHPSGALTFRFVSDGSVTEAGWEADVTCGPAPTASVQVIHNSADPAAASVDVYLNGALLPALTGVNFREASAFLTAPAVVDFTVDVVPAGAALSASVFTQTFNLAEDESYIVVADGV